MTADIIFLHAPSVYDFRKKPIFYGPISDLVPSSPVFEMYPMGFMTISAHLEEAGYRTRIVNLAVQMLSDSRFDAEKKIQKLDAKIFAIDLHWMPHAHGALEVAKMVKRHHPDAVVELGGFTSSYFYEELMRRDEVDMVMRGDSTEVPHVKLMDILTKGGDLSDVPNLAWKDRDGKVRVNPVSFIPEDIDHVRFDYGTMIRNVIRHRDIKGALPWYGWDKLPLTSVFTVRGCSCACAECGGSAFANKKVLCRSRPAFRSPERVADDIGAIQDYLRSPVFVVGDLRQAGKDYAERFFAEVKKRGIKNHLILELFRPAGEEFYKMAESALGEYSMQFSPDSHDEHVRAATGRNYDNASIEMTIQKALGNGCSRFDLFYMTGLPEQTRESAMDTVRVSERLWNMVGKNAPLYIYNAPFAPFVDPGSRAFEDPERWGYRFFARTLEEHRRILDNPSWKHTLSYETRWMTRDDIAETSYDAASELARIEHRCGRISSEEYDERTGRTGTARTLLRRIDDILLIKDAREREKGLWSIKEEGERLMTSTVCNKKDLDWKTGSIWANSPRILTGMLRSMMRK
ncbi:MAG: TIGR04190 family B12-binding domain/radical SAM domain protein [Methanomassiliicoccaceae archaeon]|jgi:B12-binding domain/radical SAM domain protein|nr:TIGR04190 family B12-binding domain/radical SAM domain protein [Methanomassiliicoccaceae archaeon]